MNRILCRLPTIVMPMVVYCLISCTTLSAIPCTALHKLLLPVQVRFQCSRVPVLIGRFQLCRTTSADQASPTGSTRKASSCNRKVRRITSVRPTVGPMVARRGSNHQRTPSALSHVPYSTRSSCPRRTVVGHPLRPVFTTDSTPWARGPRTSSG